MSHGALSDEQLERFKRDGYVIVERAFDEAEVNRMREEADYILDLIINSSIAHRRTSRRLDFMEQEDGTQHVRKIQPINDLSLYLTRVSEDPRLLEPMRQIMGCDPVLMEEKLNYKQPLLHRLKAIEARHGDDHFPIHNDWAYYKDQGYPQEIISSAISIDPCVPENGPLHVWPGTHLSHLEHVRGPIGYEVGEGAVNPQGGVDILAPAGSVMFFHSLLVHNSRPNLTSAPRRLMIYSHYPSRENHGIDVRNGPTRLRESPWEEEYHRMKEAGSFTDVFRAPR